MPRHDHKKMTETITARERKFEISYQKARAKKARRVDSIRQIDLFDGATTEYVQRDELRMAQITTRNRRRLSRAGGAMKKPPKGGRSVQGV